jgi:CRP/FNR family cyclic AMP-dependent transcriptional regulator
MTPQTLREIPLFATLDPQETDDLLKQLERKEYPSNTVIFWMDEPGDKLYIIEKGKVHISHTNKKGEAHHLATLGEKAFFGELSLLDGGLHTATARTVTETILLTIDQPAFYNFLDKHPHFSRTLLAVMVDRLRANTNSLQHGRFEDNVPPPQPASFRRFVDRAARTISSSRFLIFVILFIAGWIIFQTWYYFHQYKGAVSFSDRPPTFFILGFLLSLSSFLFTILVLTSQRGLAEQDRIQAEIEYQVNLKAQAEIMRLQLKMDEVLKMLEQKDKNDK